MNDFNNLNGSISKFLKQFNVRRSNETQLIIEIWDEMVGEVFSKNTNPVRFTNDIIYVEVNNSTWLNQIVFFKDEIIEKYNTRFRKRVVKDIKFFIKKAEEPKIVLDRPEKLETEDSKKIKIAEKLNEEDRQSIESNTSEIDDYKLRNSLKAFFEKSRKREMALEQKGWKKCSICKCLHHEKGDLCLPCHSKGGHE
jgi:hypothetical protein